MKNIIIYNKIDNSVGGGKINDFIIENYLKAQIENSLYFGWKPEDIIIATNFYFEHRGIKNLQLFDICNFSGYNNKWYGINEIFEKHFQEDCWLHDYDNWQTSEISFPNFNGQIAGCIYVYTNEWNTASMFFKRTSKNIIEYIYEFLKFNEKIPFNGDESALSVIRQINDVKEYLTTINNKYNVGLTKLEYRYNVAEKPVCTLGCKLLHKKEFDFFESKYKDLNIIPNHLYEILTKYRI